MYTREREDFSEFAFLKAFQSGEKKHSSLNCVLLTCTMPDCYFFFINRKCMVYRQKWLEGHVALPPKSQFRGQGIHTAISLRDLRDGSLENTSEPSFELRNSNYPS